MASSILESAMSDADDQRGMSCPHCGCYDLRAERRYKVFPGYRRIRYCRHCNHRVLTYEKITGDANNQKPEELT